MKILLIDENFLYMKIKTELFNQIQLTKKKNWNNFQYKS